jgi:hypothetical protein
MDGTLSRLVHWLAVALVLVLAQACGNGAGDGGSGQGAPAKAPPQQVQTKARDSAPGAVSRKPAADADVTEQVRTVVRERARGSRSISLPDPDSGHPLELSFDFLRGGVTTTAGGRHVMCTEYHAPGGTPYDVDYYVGMKDGKYVVEEVVIHKADGAVVLSNDQRERLDSAG